LLRQGYRISRNIWLEALLRQSFETPAYGGALRMRYEYAAPISTESDAAKPHPEETAKRSSRRTRRSLRAAETSSAIAPLLRREARSLNTRRPRSAAAIYPASPSSNRTPAGRTRHCGGR